MELKRKKICLSTNIIFSANDEEKKRKPYIIITKNQKRSRNWMMAEMYAESTVDSPKSSATELITPKRPRSASCSSGGMTVLLDL